MRTSSKIRLGVIAIYLILGGYIASIGLSLVQVSIRLSDSYLPGVNTGAIGPGDDSVNITISFVFSNPGIYDIYAERVYAEVFIHESTNETFLPPNTFLGEINSSYYFPARTNINESLTIDLNSSYLPWLAINNATFRLELNLTRAGFAGIQFDLRADIYYFWYVGIYNPN
ncbi:MAG: hypothetical protein HWN65_20905 [Candidatus Helarchaeota archaeon]|nr:hypothetical protein [Candidatus Helarchaeota archaeon]